MAQSEVTEVKKCRICGHSKIVTFLSLGPLPTPNAYLTDGELTLPEPTYPLDIGYCTDCGLVQLKQIVSPKIMFSNYRYVPSASGTMIEHFDELATAAIDRVKPAKDELVIDIGSNDGTLLSSFKKWGVSVLGIDPATNLAAVANSRGIETVNDFFNAKVAQKVAKQKGKAKIITATNVVAHIPDLHSVIEGVNHLLDKDGVFVTEFPYLLDLVEKTEFDTIYQEHLSYFSVKPLLRLLEEYNMHIDHIERLSIHGGSIRTFIKHGKAKKQADSVKELLALENAKGLYSEKTYKDFSDRVEKKKEQLNKLLQELKKDGKKIVGYGASARGNILLNYFKIDNNILDYIVDSTPYKQGLYTPGHHIPIKPETEILKDQPDYALLLAWNFTDEILKKQAEYRKRGGRFIQIVPEVSIIAEED